MIFISSKFRVSTAIEIASPPASLISRSTVLMVDCGEFGSGGNGCVLLASDVVLAATATLESQKMLGGSIDVVP